MKQIAAAIVKAQKEFGPALKTSTNGHFKSQYADLAACVEAVIDALNNNGIALIQCNHLDDVGVTVETILLHESGEQFSSGKLHVPASKQDPQGYGSAQTYARRYSLMAVCGIAPEDDDGNAASSKKNTPPKQVNGIDALPLDTQTELQDCAAEILVMASKDEIDKAIQYIQERNFDDTKKNVFWSLLDAKTQKWLKSGLTTKGK